MAIINGTYVSLSGLVLYSDPANSRCYVGAGTQAYNLVDQSKVLTLSSIGYSGGYFTNAAAGAIQSPTYTLSLSSGFTAIQWLNITTAAGGHFNISSGSNSIGFYQGGATTMYWDTYLAASGGRSQSNQIIPTSTWFMIAGSFSGTGSAGGSGTSKIYYNGNLDKTSTVAGTASVSAPFQIGVFGGPNNGTIGPTMFYNRVLSDTEVRNIFHAFRRRFSI